ncbi:MAG TPA: hypothetical protein VFS72_11375 [Agromyces sp.]|nr:hypothetical protein [Agromyces sp.]
MDGPSSVDDRVPEPLEDSRPHAPTAPAAPPAPAEDQVAEPPPSSSTSKVVIEWIAVLVPFTTVLAAVAFWFGWTYTTARSLYLGIDASVLGFTPTDYILYSADAVILPLVIICLAGLLWAALLAGINLQLARPERTRMMRDAALVVLAVSIVGLLVAVRAMFVDFADTMHYLSKPILLGASATFAGTAVAVLRRTWPATTHLRTRLWVRTGVVLLATIVVVSVFWGATDYAQALGRGRAMQTVVNLERRPAVAVFSTTPLALPVEEHRVEGSGRYAVRYDGLRLLLKSGGSYFLLPDGWERGDGAVIVLRDDAEIRLEYTIGGG